MKDKTRLIALSDSPEMDGELVIFETNAPSKRLKELEKESIYVDILILNSM